MRDDGGQVEPGDGRHPRVQLDPRDVVVGSVGVRDLVPDLDVDDDLVSLRLERDVRRVLLLEVAGGGEVLYEVDVCYRCVAHVGPPCGDDRLVETGLARREDMYPSTASRG